MCHGVCGFSAALKYDVLVVLHACLHIVVEILTSLNYLAMAKLKVR